MQKIKQKKDFVSYGIILRVKHGKKILSGPQRPCERISCKECYKNLHYDYKTRIVYDEPLYLLIQRKNTNAYSDIIRGRYKEKLRDNLLDIYIGELTCEERIKLMTFTFRELFDDLFVNHHCFFYKNDFEFCNSKWNNNKNVIMELLNKDKKNHYPISEVSFPKGRKNVNETDIQCALREFEEESGLPSSCINIKKNYQIVESFVGTNNIHYIHKYFIADITPESLGQNKIKFLEKQLYEVSNVGFFTESTVKKLFRSYDYAKREAFDEALYLFKELDNKIME